MNHYPSGPGGNPGRVPPPQGSASSDPSANINSHYPSSSSASSATPGYGPPPLMSNMPPPPPVGVSYSQWYGGSSSSGGGGGGSGEPGVGPMPGPAPVAYAHPPPPLQAQGVGGGQHLVKRAPIITIYDVNPQRGGEGTAISIKCDLNFPPEPTHPVKQESHGAQEAKGNRIRLCFGDIMLETTVHPPAPGDACYVVQAYIPPIASAHRRGQTSWSVAMSLEAVLDGYVVETAPLGEFTYDEIATPNKKLRKMLDSPTRKAPSVSSRRGRRGPDDAGYAHPQQMPVAAPQASFVYDSPPPTPQPGLVRTTQVTPGGNPFVQRQKAELEILGDLSTMKHGWSKAMWESRRCLVQFTRQQQGHKVVARFKSVEERDWTPNMIVISCLYHEQRRECYFTSVDAIYLLECLMATRYTTEEKNRIRRNLESFKPTTLQKNEGQWQDFYAHIMNYPNPKPRNIDKGLKVFPWVHLPAALKKIFGNYSAYVPPAFGFSADPNAVQQLAPAPVSYAHHSHAVSDGMSYTEDRAPAPRHSGIPPPPGPDHMGYVEMSPVGYHRPPPSNASGPAEMVPPSYSSTPADEFGNFVNMPPNTNNPVYPREYPQPPMGAYPAPPNPSLPHNPPPQAYPSYDAEAAPLPYQHASSSRGNPNSSDLRVAYDPSRAHHPGYPPQ